ncbi:hypothetical protein [Streptomyces sp. cg36]|uniref:hypothetical protein n=1 Tax=Streptomyces sp. cg36 TaxID=3238798 RepID=UPI0034E26195
MTNPRELNVICDRCKSPIPDGEGNIWVDNGEINKQQDAVQEWNEEQRAKTPPGLRVTHGFKDLLDYPSPVEWQAHHSACDPDPDADAYSIEVERLRTWADLTHWTAHLMGKGWLRATDWTKVLDNAAHNAGRRVSPVTKPTVNA